MFTTLERIKPKFFTGSAPEAVIPNHCLDSLVFPRCESPDELNALESYREVSREWHEVKADVEIKHTQGGISQTLPVFAPIKDRFPFDKLRYRFDFRDVNRLGSLIQLPSNLNY
jgi:hypothetical protein